MFFKAITLAAAAVAGSATLASADVSYFTLNPAVTNSIVDLGTVRSEGNGVIEIYSFHAGEQGALLGSQNVLAGANQDVRIPINSSINDVIAVLKVDGRIVATQEVDRM